MVRPFYLCCFQHCDAAAAAAVHRANTRLKRDSSYYIIYHVHTRQYPHVEFSSGCTKENEIATERAHSLEYSW